MEKLKQTSKQKLINETLFLDDKGIPMEEKIKQTPKERPMSICACCKQPLKRMPYNSFLKIRKKLQEILDWIDTPKEKRKPAMLNWTAGEERQIGYRIERLEHNANNSKNTIMENYFKKKLEEKDLALSEQKKEIRKDNRFAILKVETMDKIRNETIDEIREWFEERFCDDCHLLKDKFRDEFGKRFGKE